MTLVRITSNKTLKGHKAIIFSTIEPPKSHIDAIQKQFPDLIIKTYVQPWGAPLDPSFNEEDWKDTTVFLTATYLPKPEQVPHLQYVQLTSAGANHLIKEPLFANTKIPFSTANGVHGGILGYGSIGRQTARLSKALGLDVHAYTLHPRNTPESRRDDSYTPPGLGDPEGEFPSKWFSGGSKEEIHEFLDSGLDILVISVPLTDKTKGLISKSEFEILGKKKTFLINIARGPIVNTDDLIEALNSETIKGAALDVTDPEPLPENHPLWNAKNVTITPHMSATSSFYYTRLLDIFRLNLERLSEGRNDFINKVNRKEGY
ncbi:d-3-phosphoglycerate dehydrogenase [Fusarium beomiforme]|uniref:D-3-phosphoglycerate dehydrogenase n=1 Tax=Fusarium beomiforme TaxID=44412 RepID=A0A9P5AKZ7_9HYPO|nr:d-3-phosphoglycerate dehydrogenase [Fusarium beomiforme]